jgi:hypothetical protein
MKLIEVDSKATLEDFLTSKTFFYRSLIKGNVVYIIFFIKVKASIELSIAAHFFIVI